MHQFLFSHRLSVTGLCLAAVLSAGACAMAQPVAAPPEGPAARLIDDGGALNETRRAEHEAMRQSIREEMRAERAANGEARLEAYIAYTRTRLGISEAQAPLWEAFAATLRESRQERLDARPAPRDPALGPLTLVERIEREQARLNARSQRLAATANALLPLYGTFDDNQKRLADEMLSPDGIGEGMAPRGPRQFARRFSENVPGPRGPLFNIPVPPPPN
jgi:hypothetical protein